MDIKKSLMLLEESWSYEKIIQKIKAGAEPNQIVNEFIIRNQDQIDILNKHIKDIDREKLIEYDLALQCESILLNKIKNQNHQIKPLNSKATNDVNPKRSDFKRISIFKFLRTWSNQFMIFVLLLISSFALTSQAWS